MQKINFYIPLLFFAIGYASCKAKETTTVAEPAATTTVQTPVTVISVDRDTLQEYAVLNATSAFLQSNILKSSANGYIKSVSVVAGQLVTTGKLIFTIETKEGRHIGTLINNLDSSFRFSGITHINASQTGYISQLNHQVGDYVQDGEQLAVINTANSFGFILNVPYELKRYIPLHKNVEVDLPDGSQLNGVIALIMPAVDSVSQTQRILVSVNKASAIPENLIVKIRILKNQKNNIIALPKAAILSDDAQTNFWVMKMMDSTRAVKIPVTLGMESSGKVEIIQPALVTGDKVLISGNYGLADTANVKIVNAE